MNKLIKALPIMLLCLVVGACATFNVKMSAKKVLIMADDFYAKQYDDYLTFCVKDENGEWQIRADVSSEQREVLAKRYDALEKLDELSDTLATFIAIGQLPEGQTLPALESEIITIIRRFE